MMDAPRTGPRYGRGIGNLTGRLALAVYVTVLTALLVLPIGLVVVASFHGGLEASVGEDGWSFAAYEAMPHQYWLSLWFTIKTALLSTALALVVSVAAAWGLVRGKLRERRLVGMLVLLPDAVPSITLGIGLLVLFIPLGLSNSLAGTVVALAALGLAMGLRFAEVLMEAIPEELEQAAITMGASRLVAFLSVTLPLLAPGLAAAALFIFVHNLVTFELLLFISGPRAMPISVLLFTDIVERGVLPQAIAMSAILVYVAIAFYTLIVMTVGMRHLAGSPLSRKG
ncbi:ABC transporter permease subunit [Shinella sp.]|uniref:ABC transporter permease n=1 Tax=Shinella sp. TaxID=1870904 RepID=UPI0029A20A1C|nr:ABC transporter permease subunit [Shinella sp.]MDX3975525.1 ABC transporter permease subunit [Shinella sp.]